MTRRRLVVGVAALLATACSGGSTDDVATGERDDGAIATDPSSTARVTTTAAVPDSIEGAMQRAFVEHVPDTDGRFVAAALVMRVEDGRVVAFGRSDGLDEDLADVQRPSGSTLKLIVDVALAEAGVTADDGVITGSGCVFPDGASAPTDELMPIMSVREATATSSNCAFGKFARVLGAAELDRVASELGIERALDVGTRFGFGANTVSMAELATAGVRLVGAADPVAGLDLLPTTAGTVVDMTDEVLVSGTARGNALVDRWAIAKTGTSAYSTDAWLVGATSEYAAVVWMGNPARPEDGMVDGAVPGYETVHGGDIPARVWRDVMEFLHADLPVDEAPPSLPDREVVIVVDPTVDCLGARELVVTDDPTVPIPHIVTGGPIRC